MLKDDFSVVAYKILKYCNECLKNGTTPVVETAREISKVNETYFRAVIDDLADKGLIKQSILYADNKPYYESIRLTMEGAEYLNENSKMRHIAEYLGNSFIALLKKTIDIALNI